jgi:hypothetical protein
MFKLIESFNNITLTGLVILIITVKPMQQHLFSCSNRNKQVDDQTKNIYPHKKDHRV